jgi:hypothetical protein
VRERAGESGDEEDAGSGASAGDGGRMVTCVEGGRTAEAVAEWEELARCSAAFSRDAVQE